MDVSTLEDLLESYFPSAETKKARRRDYIRKKVAEYRRKSRAQREAAIAAAAAAAANTDDDSDLDMVPADHPAVVNNTKSGPDSSEESDCATPLPLPRSSGLYTESTSPSKRMRKSNCHFPRRRSKKAKKFWAVFDFASKRPESLVTVPGSWVKVIRREISRLNSNNKASKTTCCFWPKKSYCDERKLKQLIMNSSDPDEVNWLCLDGSLKGIFKDMREAESYIAKKLRTEYIEIKEERLSDDRDEAALIEGEMQIGDGHKRMSDSNSPKLPTTRTQSTSTPSTSGSFPKDSGAMTVAEAGDAHCEVPNGGLLEVQKGALLEVQNGALLEVQNGAVPMDNYQMFQTIMEKLVRIETRFDAFEERVCNLINHNAVVDDPPRTPTAPQITNPFDALSSFGFKVTSVEELIQREQQFSDDNIDGKKNRTMLLNILLELAPKPSGKTKINAVDVVRAAMQQLANDEHWQYFCSRGKSGSKKIAMNKRLNNIYRVICLTAVKILSIDFRDAATAIAMYLKNTASRAASKKHRILLDAQQEKNLAVLAKKDDDDSGTTSEDLLTRRKDGNCSGVADQSHHSHIRKSFHSNIRKLAVNITGTICSDVELQSICEDDIDTDDSV